jgi:hypothetical protein
MVILHDLGHYERWPPPPDIAERIERLRRRADQRLPLFDTVTDLQRPASMSLGGAGRSGGDTCRAAVVLT